MDHDDLKEEKDPEETRELISGEGKSKKKKRKAAVPVKKRAPYKPRVGDDPTLDETPSPLLFREVKGHTAQVCATARQGGSSEAYCNCHIVLSAGESGRSPCSMKGSGSFRRLYHPLMPSVVPVPLCCDCNVQCTDLFFIVAGGPWELWLGLIEYDFNYNPHHDRACTEVLRLPV
ncbi:unnamed protein product [Discosporangium mesarthrocarpum]